MKITFNICLIVLILLVSSIRAEQDCLTAEWEGWTACVETGIDLLQTQGVGKLSRNRSRLGGKHCLRQDLTEIKLCVFNESSDSNTEPDESGEQVDGGDVPEDGGEEKKPRTEDGGDEKKPRTEDGGNEKKPRTEDGGSTAEEPGQDVEHLSDDRTERTVFITLLSVATAILTTGGVVGAIIIRQHRTLQRRHKILVMTKERIRLIDGKKLEVKRSTSMFCGLGPQFTVQNPAYESEDDEQEWVRASTFPTGQLKLQSN